MQSDIVEPRTVERESLVCVQEESPQPSITILPDYLGSSERSGLVLIQQGRELAAATGEVVVSADHAERGVLKRDWPVRIYTPVERLQRGESIHCFIFANDRRRFVLGSLLDIALSSPVAEPTSQNG